MSYNKLPVLGGRGYDEDSDDELVDVVVSSSEDEGDEELKTHNSLRPSAAIATPNKWRVEVRPRVVTSSHSLSALVLARPSRSRLNLVPVSPSDSTTSLVRKILSTNDFEIPMSDEQLDDFRRIMLAAFDKSKEKVT